jgi:hypothetical protein
LAPAEMKAEAAKKKKVDLLIAQKRKQASS